MKTCITFHPHELARCPGPVTLLRPVHSSCLEIPSCCPFGSVGDVLAVRETWRMYWFYTEKHADVEFPDGCFKECAGFYGVRYLGTNWRSPATMPSALARWQFTVEGVEVKRAFDVSDTEWTDHYPRYPWASNPLLWVMRGNVEAKR